jgi:D-alanine transaminase
MPELAYVNGNIMPIQDATIPIEDRGYQFGDAVYEYITSFNKRPFLLDEHLARLKRSMTELSFPLVDMDTIRSAVLEIFDKGGYDNGDVYIQISRGVAPRDHAFPESNEIQFIMTVRETKRYSDEMHANGIKVITVEDQRWGRCDIKTVQLLYNALAKQKALDSGAYDAVFVGPDNVVREGTSSNLFIIVDQTLITHPLTPNILPGITRACLLQICRERSIPFQERFFDTNELYAADEAFLSGTTTEVLPLIEIDGHPIGQGGIGAISKKLLAALRNKM